MLKTTLALMTAAAVALPGTSDATPLGRGFDVSRALPHQAIQLGARPSNGLDERLAG
jgi:hypothetical protein